MEKSGAYFYGLNIYLAHMFFMDRSSFEQKSIKRETKEIKFTQLKIYVIIKYYRTEAGGDGVAAKFKAGDTAYLIESNRIIREITIVKFGGGFYLIRFKDSGGGIKVRENRLYASKEEAENAMTKAHSKTKPSYSPWNYM